MSESNLSSGDNYEIGEGIIKDDLIVAKKIYVELGFLQYLELGRILTSPSMNEETYSAIVERLASETFKNRVTDDIQYLFRDIALPRIFTETSDDKILLMSPSFVGTKLEIKDFIGSVKESLSILRSLDQIEFFLDISKVPKLSLRIKAKLLQELVNYFDVRVTLVNKTLTAESKYDAYFLADLGAFTKAKLEPLNKQSLIDTPVICRKIIPLTQLDYLREHPDEIPQTFNNIELLMSAACKFTFTNPPSCHTE